jgi:hypothetical protein
MMALLSIIILFVTTDICAFMQTIIKIFPKTHRFFTISFNQANDVYVKIYETAQLTTFYVANVL